RDGVAVMIESRHSVAVTICRKNDIKSIHFSGIPKLSGHKGTLNFPYNENTSLFVQIENIMLVNGMCNNVTHVERLRHSQKEEIYSVIYNRRPLKNKFRK
ncbi:hypothetical protein, partial [Escherichia coli]